MLERCCLCIADVEEWKKVTQEDYALKCLLLLKGLITKQVPEEGSILVP